MGAAAPGRNNLHSLRNRLAANSEFSPRNSGSAFGQAVKNLWHRGIPTPLPNRLSAASGGHWLVHGQTDDHCPMSERILRMHLLPNMQLTSFVESALLTINREGYRRGGPDGAVLDVTMVRHSRPLRRRVIISSTGGSYSIKARVEPAPRWGSCLSSAPSPFGPFRRKSKASPCR